MKYYMLTIYLANGGVITVSKVGEGYIATMNVKNEDPVSGKRCENIEDSIESLEKRLEKYF